MYPTNSGDLELANNVIPGLLPVDNAPADAGFDIIMQFSQKFVSDQFSASVSNLPYSLKKYYSYSSAMLSPRITGAISDITATLNAENPGESFMPVKFAVSLVHPVLELLTTDPDVKVIATWQLVLAVSMATGVDVPLHSFRERVLAIGRVTTRPSIDLVKNATMHQIRAELDFSYSKAKITDADPMMTEFIQGFLPSCDIPTAINDVMTILQQNRPRITPQMSVGGKMFPGQQLPFADTFVAACVIGQQNGASIFSICANVFSTSGWGTLTMVPAMLGSSRFAYYVSEQTARAVVFHRWGRKDTIKEFIEETKVPLQDPHDKDAVVWGKAQVKWVWKTLDDVFIPPAPATHGALRIKGMGELTILTLWNQDGRDIKPADQPALFAASSQPYAMDFLPLQQGSEVSTGQARAAGKSAT